MTPEHTVHVKHVLTWNDDDQPTFANYDGKLVRVRRITWHGRDPWAVDLEGWYMKKDGTPGAQYADTTIFPRGKFPPEVRDLIDRYSEDMHGDVTP